MKRVYSIDVLRGIVMVIMTLDHVRDLLHTTAITQQPTDLKEKCGCGIFKTQCIFGSRN
jgi:uncharacterized membrane protein